MVKEKSFEEITVEMERTQQLWEKIRKLNRGEKVSKDDVTNLEDIFGFFDKKEKNV